MQVENDKVTPASYPMLKNSVDCLFNALSDLGSMRGKNSSIVKPMLFSLAADVNVKFRKVILDKSSKNIRLLLLATDLLFDIDSECVVNYELRARFRTLYPPLWTNRPHGQGGLRYYFLISHPEELKIIEKYACS